MKETQFICTGCGADVRTFRFVNYRTIPPSVDERDLCMSCKDAPAHIADEVPPFYFWLGREAESL